ncbi:aspartic peptidase domain-containing protein [Mycena rebaudengoi]|nr:aspartic peptidase domain-containing protein [Mycena rebaudengoi]
MWLLPLPLPAFLIWATIPFESLLFLMLCSTAAVASPHQPTSPDAISSEATSSPIHLLLGREIGQQLTPSDLVVADRTHIIHGFSPRKHESLKRSIPAQDFDLMLDEGGDYTIILDIGTPTQSLAVIPDTDAANLTLPSSCGNCANVYNSSASSTFVPDKLTGFPTETVALGQFIVHSQTFDYRPGLATGTSTESTFLQNILAVAQAPEFAFWFKRGAQAGSAAGVLTVGGRNSSLFVGDMEFHNIAGATPTHWQIQLSAITVQGKTITIPETSSLSTFDTTQSLIQGPTSEVATIWAAIPGSSGPTLDGYYHFPCNPEVNITISFGGKAWPLNPADLSGGVVANDTSMCIGNIVGYLDFEKWRFRTAFLRNVYSVYRQVPPSVGFAQLSPMAGGPSSTTPNPGTSTSSSPQTFTSSPPIKRKFKIGSAVGGAVGGLVLMLIGIGVWLCLHRRRKKGNRDQITVFHAPPPNGHRTKDPVASLNQDGMPIMHSIQTMRRGKNGAVNHASDGAHVVVDALTMTPGRPQLIPAQTVYADNGQLPNELPDNPVAHSASNVDEVQPPDIASPGGPVNPIVWNELRRLRAEVERLAARRDSLQAPPSYNSRESEEEDR